MGKNLRIPKYDNHPSIEAIKSNITFDSNFEFSEIGLDEIIKEINNLDAKKNGTFKNIPTKRLKEVSDIAGSALLNIWNNEIINQKFFPKNLKVADITPVFKKEDTTAVKNYRPVSVLPTVSKVIERLLQKQVSEYMENFLSKY